VVTEIHVRVRSNQTLGEVQEAKIVMAQEGHRMFLDALHKLHVKLRKGRFVIQIRGTAMPGGSSVVNKDSNNSSRKSVVFRKH
jgi:predicted DNA-binding helix-hairpin-helix protein